MLKNTKNIGRIKSFLVINNYNWLILVIIVNKNFSAAVKLSLETYKKFDKFNKRFAQNPEA